jgi:hypothetical protein
VLHLPEGVNIEPAGGRIVSRLACRSHAHEAVAEGTRDKTRGRGPQSGDTVILSPELDPAYTARGRGLARRGRLSARAPGLAELTSRFSPEAPPTGTPWPVQITFRPGREPLAAPLAHLQPGRQVSARCSDILNLAAVS